ncbi:unnamed protein product [Sphenostylis stenocarpa]|uniref:DNA-repair protein Xrcc1 N-terminal domain-containing protein n=1 Tax=Sphenostylis stenocarpa TaxID=92480 RepID=A0AA86VY73_9FABA|nr:unnamed protein product [Sphenostylis stenocarpa]
MEAELEPRVKALPFKVKATSRESASQKALNVLDNDLRTHWSTATNTKEWILLELDFVGLVTAFSVLHKIQFGSSWTFVLASEPCLLSHIRIYNKSVLEWEIAVGLRYKPETFQKVRPRCEAPRRDMIYPTNYTPCRYVRISCLRGNPIAIFFVQLIGVSVAGLEPEFQPVVNHLLPHILSHKQDPHDIHLQVDYLASTDLSSFPDNPESNIRFLAMLAGPLYPILHVVNESLKSKPFDFGLQTAKGSKNYVGERDAKIKVDGKHNRKYQFRNKCAREEVGVELIGGEGKYFLCSGFAFRRHPINASKGIKRKKVWTTSKPPGNIADLDVSKSSQLSPILTVSSNFEVHSPKVFKGAKPRRSRSASPLIVSSYRAIVFRPDAIFVLLRKAYKDSDLGSVCRMASKIMHKLINPDTKHNVSNPQDESTSPLEDKSNLKLSSPVNFVDYSKMLGEEFRIPDEQWDCSYLNILDIGVVEEGILHVLYSCASQPVLCSKLAERCSDLWAALPLVQALLPALRPWVSNSFDVVDDTFSQWKQPIVQQALSQIVASAISVTYQSLVHACAGYLSSYSPSHRDSSRTLQEPHMEEIEILNIAVHARAACVLIDLCSGVLAPWMTHVIAKVDLALELLEDLLGIIQDAHNSLVRARAALKYIVLALSGHMDDILGKYKSSRWFVRLAEVKHKILFLLEMLEPFLDPAIAVSKSKIAFGDLASSFPEKQEHNCTIALNIIRTAVQKPAVLPSLESEWRLGSVAPRYCIVVAVSLLLCIVENLVDIL